MSRNRFVDFDLGPALVQRLLPQRPPFLMIDRFDAFAPDEPIAVRASRYLSANEPVFQGHFPQLPLLPGALMVEGVGQTASLAFTMSAIRDAYVERGLDLETLVADLKNLDRGFSLKPGYRPDPEAPILEAFSVVGGMPVGVAGGIRM